LPLYAHPGLVAGQVSRVAWWNVRATGSTASPHRSTSWFAGSKISTLVFLPPHLQHSAVEQFGQRVPVGTGMQTCRPD
jgi:hypothetical protein